MAEKKKNKRKDISELARSIVEKATGEKLVPIKKKRKKNKVASS